jgi:Flp pilus assembly protein TadG
MKRREFQDGSQLVEFALVLPVLLLVLFGAIDFSLAFYDKAVLTNASREGARAGIVATVPKLTEAQIETVALNYCTSHLVNFSGASAPTAEVTGAAGASGAPLKVDVRYYYHYVMLARLVPFLSSLNLTSTTVMRME